MSVVDSVRVTYNHLAIADGNSLVATPAFRQVQTIDGFSSGQVRVVDLTTPAAVNELGGTVAPTSLGYSVSVQAGSARSLFAFTPDQVLQPATLAVNTPSSWHSSAQAADIVIITHRDFAASAASLKAFRESQGYRVALVDVDDVYDEFGYGNHAPQAIKAFLTVAKNTWRAAPKFVVLVGDGSYDPRDRWGLGSVDFVPAKLVDTEILETASDDWFTDFNNDDIPDIAIGRLPVRTSAEADVIINKTIGFAQAIHANRSALLVADTPDAENFETDTVKVAATLPGDYSVTQVYRSALGDSVAHQQIVSGIDAGPAIVNFSGHGSITIWRGGLLTSADAPNLSNGQNPSFFVMANCLNGYFQDPTVPSLGEALLGAENGGAIGVWASSGMTDPRYQSPMNQEFFRQLFNGQGLTVGEAAARAKAAASGDIRRTWVLLGDPVTKIQ